MNKKDRPRPSWRPPPVLDKHAKPTSVWDSAVESRFHPFAALGIALGILCMVFVAFDFNAGDIAPKPSDDPPKPSGAPAQADSRSFSPEFRRAALAEGVKIEPDARDFLPGSSSDKIFTLQYAMAMIAVKGWRCDSISSATPHLFSIGYNIYCNEFRYSYDIKDRGGTWTVTLN